MSDMLSKLQMLLNQKGNQIVDTMLLKTLKLLMIREGTVVAMLRLSAQHGSTGTITVVPETLANNNDFHNRVIADIVRGVSPKKIANYFVPECEKHGFTVDTKTIIDNVTGLQIVYNKLDPVLMPFVSLRSTGVDTMAKALLPLLASGIEYLLVNIVDVDSALARRCVHLVESSGPEMSRLMVNAPLHAGLAIVQAVVTTLMDENTLRSQLEKGLVVCKDGVAVSSSSAFLPQLADSLENLVTILVTQIPSLLIDSQLDWNAVQLRIANRILRVILSKTVVAAIRDGHKINDIQQNIWKESLNLSLLDFDALERWVAKRLSSNEQHLATAAELNTALNTLLVSASKMINQVDGVTNEIIPISINELVHEISDMADGMKLLEPKKLEIWRIAVFVVIMCTFDTSQGTARSIAQLTLRDIKELLKGVSAAANCSVNSMFEAVKQNPNLRRLQVHLQIRIKVWLLEACKLPQMVVDPIVDMLFSGECFAPFFVSTVPVNWSNLLAAFFEGLFRRVFKISSERGHTSAAEKDTLSTLLLELALNLMEHDILKRRLQERDSIHTPQEQSDEHDNRLNRQVDALMSVLKHESSSTISKISTQHEWHRASDMERALGRKRIRICGILSRRLCVVPALIRIAARDDEVGQIAQSALGGWKCLPLSVMRLVDAIKGPGHHLRYCFSSPDKKNCCWFLPDAHVGPRVDPLVIRLPNELADQLAGIVTQVDVTSMDADDDSACVPTDHEVFVSPITNTDPSGLEKLYTAMLNCVARKTALPLEGVKDFAFLATIYTSLQRAAHRAARFSKIESDIDLPADTVQTFLVPPLNMQIEAQLDLLKSKTLQTFIKQVAATSPHFSTARMMSEMLSKRAPRNVSASDRWSMLRNIFHELPQHRGFVTKSRCCFPKPNIDSMFDMAQPSRAYRRQTSHRAMVGLREQLLKKSLRNASTHYPLKRLSEEHVEEAVTTLYKSKGTDASYFNGQSRMDAFRCHECFMTVAPKGHESNCKAHCSTQCPGGAWLARFGNLSKPSGQYWPKDSFPSGIDNKSHKIFSVSDDDADIWAPVLFQLISAFATGSGRAQQIATDALCVAETAIGCRLCLSLINASLSSTEARLVVQTLRLQSQHCNYSYNSSNGFALLIGDGVPERQQARRALHSLLVSDFAIEERNIREIDTDMTDRLETTSQIVDIFKRIGDSSSKEGGHVVVHVCVAETAYVGDYIDTSEFLKQLPSHIQVFLLADCSIESGFPIPMSTFDVNTGKSSIDTLSDELVQLQILSALVPDVNEEFQEGRLHSGYKGPSITSSFIGVLEKRRSNGLPILPDSLVQLTLEMTEASLQYDHGDHQWIRPRASCSTMMAPIQALDGFLGNAQKLDHARAILESAVTKAVRKMSGLEPEHRGTARLNSGHISTRNELLDVVSSRNVLRAAYTAVLQSIQRVPAVLYVGLDLDALEDRVQRHTIRASSTMEPTHMQRIVSFILPGIFVDMMKSLFQQKFGMQTNESNEIVTALHSSMSMDLAKLDATSICEGLRRMYGHCQDMPLFVRALQSIVLRECFGVHASRVRLLVDALVLSYTLQMPPQTRDKRIFDIGESVQLSFSARSRLASEGSRRLQDKRSTGVIVDRLRRHTCKGLKVWYRVRFPFFMKPKHFPDYDEVREYLRTRELDFLYHQLDKRYLLSIQRLREMQESDLRHVHSELTPETILDRIRNEHTVINMHNENEPAQRFALIVGFRSQCKAIQLMFQRDFDMDSSNIRIVNDGKIDSLRTDLQWLVKCASTSRGACLSLFFSGRCMTSSSSQGTFECLLPNGDVLANDDESFESTINAYHKALKVAQLRDMLCTLPQNTKVFMLMDIEGDFSGSELGCNSYYQTETGVDSHSSQVFEFQQKPSHPAVQIVTRSSSKGTDGSLAATFRAIVKRGQSGDDTRKLPDSMMELIAALENVDSNQQMTEDLETDCQVPSLRASASEGALLRQPILALDDMTSRMLNLWFPGQPTHRDFWYRSTDLQLKPSSTDQPDTYPKEPDLQQPLPVDEILAHFLLIYHDLKHLNMIVDLLDGHEAGWMRLWNLRTDVSLNRQDVKRTMKRSVEEALRRFTSLQLMDRYNLSAGHAVHLTRTIGLWKHAIMVPLPIRVANDVLHCRCRCRRAKKLVYTIPLPVRVVSGLCHCKSDTKVRRLVCLCMYSALKQALKVSAELKLIRPAIMLAKLVVFPFWKVVLLCRTGCDNKMRVDDQQDALEAHAEPEANVEHVSTSTTQTADMHPNIADSFAEPEPECESVVQLRVAQSTNLVDRVRSPSERDTDTGNQNVNETHLDELACKSARYSPPDRDDSSIILSSRLRFDQHQKYWTQVPPQSNMLWTVLFFLLIQVTSVVISVPDILDVLSSCTVGLINGNFGDCTFSESVFSVTTSEGTLNNTSGDSSFSSASSFSSTDNLGLIVQSVNCSIGFERRTERMNEKIMSEIIWSGVGDTAGLVAGIVGKNSLSYGGVHGGIFRQIVLLGSCAVPVVFQIEDWFHNFLQWRDGRPDSALPSMRCVKKQPKPVESRKWQTSVVTALKVRIQF
eukprot:COSAG01_NODE_1817_length_9164_cov_20.194264_2_plen_2552_part_00